MEGVKRTDILSVQLFVNFFLVCFLSWIMILCVLKQILHKKKSISEIAQAALMVDGYF